MLNCLARCLTGGVVKAFVDSALVARGFSDGSCFAGLFQAKKRLLALFAFVEELLLFLWRVRCHKEAYRCMAISPG